MSFNNQFPYSDFHEINLNKFLKAIKNLLGGHGGEYLKKVSNIPFDYEWSNIEASSGVNSVNGKTGTVVLDASDVGALPDSYTPPPAPVQSVNGQTGTVVLDASDVGALPDSYTPPPAPVQSVNGQTGAVLIPLPDEGSNYIKFPSGTMLCWGVTAWTAVSANSYSDVFVVFPVSFIDDPIVVAGMGSDSSAAEMGNISVATYSRSSTGATFRIFSKASTGRSPRVFWQAVGKWK